jgi:hypothetical protein
MKLDFFLLFMVRPEIILQEEAGRPNLRRRKELIRLILSCPCKMGKATYCCLGE